MRGFVRFFVERHLLVNVMALSIAVLGWFFIKDVPREYIPSINTPIFYINAVLPGASARDIETKLTIPIEEAIDEVDGLDVYSSVISDNLSFTTVEAYVDTPEDEISRIEQDLRNAVEGITDFPPEMEDEPTIDRFDPEKWPVVEIALSGPPSALVHYANALERRLRRIELIARATVVGLQDPEVRVLVDPVRATEHGVTLLDVVRAVERRNVSSTGGVLETAAGSKAGCRVEPVRPAGGGCRDRASFRAGRGYRAHSGRRPRGVDARRYRTADAHRRKARPVDRHSQTQQRGRNRHRRRGCRTDGIGAAAGRCHLQARQRPLLLYTQPPGSHGGQRHPRGTAGCRRAVLFSCAARRQSGCWSVFRSYSWVRSRSSATSD